MADKSFSQPIFTKLSLRGFWGCWSRIWSQIYKI